MNTKRLLLSSMLCLSALPGMASVRVMKADDPNLDPKWDWTARSQHLAYASSTGAVVEHKVWSPYYTSGNPLMRGDQPDHHPEDGWVLVHRDFGRADSAQPFPFFSLYNRYKGTFRVMVFNAMVREEAIYLGELSFLGGGERADKASALLAFNDDHKPFLKDHDPTLKVIASSNMRAYGDWAVFDFPLVGYDPATHQGDKILTFKFSALDKSRLNVTGKGELDLRQAFDQNEVRPGFCSNAFSVIGAGVQALNTYDEAKSFIKNEIRSEAGIEKNKDKAWFALATQLAAGSCGTLYPYAMAIGGLLTNFIGGANSGGGAQQLRFDGQFEFRMDGAIETRRELWAHNFYLTPGAQDELAQRPLQAIDWGIVSLEEAPYYTNGNHTRTGAQDPRPELWKHNQSKHRNVARLLAKPKVLVNPKCGMELVSTRVAFAFEPPQGLAFPGHVTNLKTDTSGYLDLATACQTGFDCHYLPLWTGSLGRQPWGAWTIKKVSGLLFEFKFKVKEPTRFLDKEIVIIKRVPGRTHTNSWELPVPEGPWS